MQSDICKLRARLAVTCHLHFWQNDRDLLRATAVTRGWNGYRNKSQHRKLILERKFTARSCRGSNLRPFYRESGALTTELSLLPCLLLNIIFFFFFFLAFFFFNTIFLYQVYFIFLSHFSFLNILLFNKFMKVLVNNCCFLTPLSSYTVVVVVAIAVAVV